MRERDKGEICWVEFQLGSESYRGKKVVKKGLQPNKNQDQNIQIFQGHLGGLKYLRFLFIIYHLWLIIDLSIVWISRLDDFPTIFPVPEIDFPMSLFFAHTVHQGTTCSCVLKEMEPWRWTDESGLPNGAFEPMSEVGRIWVPYNCISVIDRRGLLWEKMV